MGSTEGKRGKEQRKEEGGASDVSHTAAAIFRAKLAPYVARGGRAWSLRGSRRRTKENPMASNSDLEGDNYKVHYWA